MVIENKLHPKLTKRDSFFYFYPWKRKKAKGKREK
jgi:hypothetical protein